MYKFILTRIITALTMAALVFFTYAFGADTLVQLMKWDNLFVRILGGTTASAAIYFLIEKIHTFVFYVLKSGTIWSICNPDVKKMLEAARAVTLNWKEIFTIPVINTAVRDIFTQVESFIGQPEASDIFAELNKYTLFKKCKYPVMKVFDYADECVMAWCYSHNDTLMTECMTGIFVFIKHLPEMLVNILPVVLIQIVLRIITALGCVYVYLRYIGFDMTTVMHAWIAAICVDYVLRDAILDPLFLPFIVRKYLQYKDETTESLSSVAEIVSSSLDFEQLKSLIERFTENGNRTDTDPGSQANTPENFK